MYELPDLQIIKFMNWEESFCGRIGMLRRDEVYAARMAAITRSVYTAFSEFQPLLILIVSLGSYSAIFGHTLTASVAFPTLNFLSILRAPLVQFPDGELVYSTSICSRLPTDFFGMQRSSQLGHGRRCRGSRANFSVFVRRCCCGLRTAQNCVGL